MVAAVETYGDYDDALEKMGNGRSRVSRGMSSSAHLMKHTVLCLVVNIAIFVIFITIVVMWD